MIDKFVVHVPNKYSVAKSKLEFFDLKDNTTTCSIVTSTSREFAFGGIISGHLVICGGVDLNVDLGVDFYNDAFQDCLITGKENSYSIDMVDSKQKSQKRYYAAAVALNETTLWIVGGRVPRKTYSSSYTYATRTSLFVTLDKTVAIYGPVLPKHPGARHFSRYLWFLVTSIGRF